MDGDPLIYKEHYKGAASELKAATYYLEGGCQVYFPAVAQGEVDFIAETYTGLRRIQVKTGVMNKSGSNYYLQCRVSSTNSPHKEPEYDDLFVVYNNEMWVIPIVYIESSNISLRNKKWDIFKVTN
jgi:hypothetical protein